jgi:hypothetical protein
MPLDHLKADREFPPKYLAALPVDQVAQRPWLLLMTPEVLVCPFAHRKGGPTPNEMRAIKTMQQRLMKTPISVWISQDGRLTPEETDQYK